MKDKHSLVLIGDKIFVMLDLNRYIRNYQCNDIIFKDKKDATLDTNVFDYFNIKVVNIIDELDNKTKNIRKNINRYGSFSVSFLPKIKKRLDKISAKTKK